MEEVPPDTEGIITKLNSSLPVCRVCLEVSMEYIEFEATLCIINGREVTFSEGFHKLIAEDKDLPHRNMITNFCSTCGLDLLNAYLFMERIEHANYALQKVKTFNEENSKFLVDDYNASSDYAEEKEDTAIYFSNAESDTCKKNYETQTSQYKSDNFAKNTASDISSIFDTSVKVENIDEGECESVNEATYKQEVFMENEQLSEPTTHLLDQEINKLEPNSNRRESESDTWVTNEYVFLSATEEEDLVEHDLNLRENELTKCIHCCALIDINDIESHNLVFHEYSNENHNNEPRETKDYICSICCCAFQTKRSLYFHKRSIHKTTETNSQKGKQYIKPQYCRKMIHTSNTDKYLITHLTGRDNGYNCTLCEKTFATMVNLKHHSYTHTRDENRYVCHICEKICMRPFTLRNHIQAKHLSERRTHQCEECGLFFSFPSHLKEHRSKHNLNNRFKCTHCDRTFMRKPQLEIHMRYHLNDFPYKCDQCDKCYVSKSNLTDHIKSKHTKTTYDCDRCNQKFKSQTGLRKHKYAHDGYPYTCPLCSVGQTSRSGMKQHLMGVHKDALTEEEFDSLFPIIIPKTGYRRPKHM